MREIVGVELKKMQAENSNFIRQVRGSMSYAALALKGCPKDSALSLKGSKDKGSDLDRVSIPRGGGSRQRMIIDQAELSEMA